MSQLISSIARTPLPAEASCQLPISFWSYWRKVEYMIRLLLKRIVDRRQPENSVHCVVMFIWILTRALAYYNESLCCLSPWCNLYSIPQPSHSCSLGINAWKKKIDMIFSYFDDTVISSTTSVAMETTDSCSLVVPEGAMLHISLNRGITTPKQEKADWCLNRGITIPPPQLSHCSYNPAPPSSVSACGIERGESWLVLMVLAPFTRLLHHLLPHPSSTTLLACWKKNLHSLPLLHFPYLAEMQLNFWTEYVLNWAATHYNINHIWCVLLSSKPFSAEPAPPHHYHQPSLTPPPHHLSSSSPSS